MMVGDFHHLSTISPPSFHHYTTTITPLFHHTSFTITKMVKSGFATYYYTLLHFRYIHLMLINNVSV